MRTTCLWVTWRASRSSSLKALDVGGCRTIGHHPGEDDLDCHHLGVSSVSQTRYLRPCLQLRGGPGCDSGRTTGPCPAGRRRAAGVWCDGSARDVKTGRRPAGRAGSNVVGTWVGDSVAGVAPVADVAVESVPVVADSSERSSRGIGSMRYCVVQNLRPRITFISRATIHSTASLPVHSPKPDRGRRSGCARRAAGRNWRSDSPPRHLTL